MLFEVVIVVVVVVVVAWRKGREGKGVCMYI
jgi:hypothetical protein